MYLEFKDRIDVFKFQPFWNLNKTTGDTSHRIKPNNRCYSIFIFRDEVSTVPREPLQRDISLQEGTHLRLL